MAVSPIVYYDYNAPRPEPNHYPTYGSDCVTATDIFKNNIDVSRHDSGGRDGSAFSCYGGWTFANKLQTSKTTFTPSNATIYFNVTFGNDATGTITSLSFDSFRSKENGTAPTDFVAGISWVDDTDGSILTAYSDVISLGAEEVWYDHTVTFSNGSSLPSGGDIASEEFLVELHAFGQTGVQYFDNVSLNGNITCVPEPTSTLLAVLAGCLCLSRRRR